MDTDLVASRLLTLSIYHQPIICKHIDHKIHPHFSKKIRGKLKEI